MMIPSRNEHTIAAGCEVHGRGYWSGQPVRVRIEPAPAGSGIRLVRTDLPDRPECLASFRTTQGCRYRTNLASGNARFEMVEHLMAALAALEIDNCRVRIDAEELPGLDGSSGPYVEALRHAGLVIQARLRPRLVITERVRLELDGGWVEAGPSPDGGSHFEYRLSYDDGTPIPDQRYRCRLSPERFIREIASARTFVTAGQAGQLRSRGIASHVTEQDLLVFDEAGPRGNRLRYPDECARHKTLDLIGDLSLAGGDLVGRFVSHRGGHRLNAMLARELGLRLSDACRRVAPDGVGRFAA